MTNYIMPALNLEKDEWSSLYIKVVPTDITVDGILINNEENLKMMIENYLHLGKVDRIDFTKRRGDNGTTIVSAYVHMFMWDAHFGKYCRDGIDTNGSVSYLGYTDINGNQIPFMGKWFNGVSKKRFLVVRKNFNPVSKTNDDDMNMEQLMGKCKRLETHNEELHKRVEEFVSNERRHLLNEVNELKKMIDTQDKYKVINNNTDPEYAAEETTVNKINKQD